MYAEQGAGIVRSSRGIPGEPMRTVEREPQFERLGKLICSLGEAVESAEHRLSPVLSPQGASLHDGGKDKPMMVSPLADQCDVLQSLIYRLGGVIARVDL